MPSIRSPSEAITQVRWSTSAVAEARGQQPLGHRHADRVGDALAERAGGGLDARVLAVAPDGRRRASGAAGTASGARCPCRHGRSGAAGRRAAWSRARPRARSGRGPASADRRRRICRNRVHSTVAASAMPIGMPGWPDFAASTASIASARMASAMRRSSVAGRARIAACAARAGLGRGGRLGVGFEGGHRAAAISRSRRPIGAEAGAEQPGRGQHPARRPPSAPALRRAGSRPATAARSAAAAGRRGCRGRHRRCAPRPGGRA